MPITCILHLNYNAYVQLHLVDNITPWSLLELMLAQNRLAVCITDTHATHAQLMAIWFPLPIRINTNTTWPFINSLVASSYSNFTEGCL